MIHRDILLMWYLLSIDLVIISFSKRRSGKQSILFLFKISCQKELPEFEHGKKLHLDKFPLFFVSRYKKHCGSIFENLTSV